MKKEDRTQYAEYDVSEVQASISRREYLLSLKKWSKVVIGGVLFGGVLANTGKKTEAAAWINNRGNWGNGAWKNGGGWVNNRGGWGNGSGGTGWANGGSNWSNGSGGWNNCGGSWANTGSGGWINRH